MVDILLNAQPDLRLIVPIHGDDRPRWRPVKTVNLEGLLLTKQTLREKDAADRAIIERAIDMLRTVQRTTRNWKTKATNMDRDAILPSPGPLTTTLRTKLAQMLRDWGSGCRLQRRDGAAAHRLLDVVDGHDTRRRPAAVAEPSASRPRWRRSCRRGSHVLVPDNGACTQTRGEADPMMGRRSTVHRRLPAVRCRPAAVDERLSRPVDHSSR